MRLRLALLSTLVCAALTAGVVLAFDLSVERAILLAPAFVVGAGLLAGVFVLLGRAAADSFRGTRHPP